jgi:hypothetical protein
LAAVTNAGDRFASGSVTAETDADGIIRQQTFTATDGMLPYRCSTHSPQAAHCSLS